MAGFMWDVFGVSRHQRMVSIATVCILCCLSQTGVCLEIQANKLASSIFAYCQSPVRHGSAL